MNGRLLFFLCDIFSIGSFNAIVVRADVFKRSVYIAMSEQLLDLPYIHSSLSESCGKSTSESMRMDICHAGSACDPVEDESNAA